MIPATVQYPRYQRTEDTMHTFDNTPLGQWLTASQIAKLLPDTSKRRVQEVLAELRDEYETLPEPPYRLIGRAYLYHPDFVELVDSRDKTRGKKPDSN